MSVYTTTIRNYLKGKLQENNPTEDIENLPYKEVIERGMNYLFDFDYPIFDENYRSVLQTKIIKNYFVREIAHETIGLFKLRLDNKLNLIMTKYNKMYESELIKIDPINDYSLTENLDRTKKDDENGITNGTITDNGTNIGNSKNIYYKYPQTHISGNKDYATDMNEINSNETITNTNESDINTTRKVTTTDEYVKSLKGNKTSQAKLIMEFRESLISIDQLIIDELEELFFLLW